jgi:hypothetical protein
MFHQHLGFEDYWDRVAPLLGAGMRLGGMAAAFNQRCFEVQAVAAAEVVREWTQLLLAARRTVDGMFYEFPGSSAPPLGGPRRSDRRGRSVVISFPDRRVPVT